MRARRQRFCGRSKDQLAYCKTLEITPPDTQGHEITLKMGWSYAAVLPIDSGATLDDLREAVTTLEEVARTARRVLGGTHPFLVNVESHLRYARATLRARETPASSA